MPPAKKRARSVRAFGWFSSVKATIVRKQPFPTNFVESKRQISCPNLLSSQNLTFLANVGCGMGLEGSAWGLVLC